MSFCSKCGFELSDSDIFCTSCGNKVKNENLANTTDNINEVLSGAKSDELNTYVSEKPKSKVNKKLIAIVSSVAIIVLIGIIVIFSISQSQKSVESTLEMFEEAINDRDLEDLYTLYGDELFRDENSRETYLSRAKDDLDSVIEKNASVKIQIKDIEYINAEVVIETLGIRITQRASVTIDVTYKTAEGIYTEQRAVKLNKVENKWYIADATI